MSIHERISIKIYTPPFLLVDMFSFSGNVLLVDLFTFLATF